MTIARTKNGPKMQFRVFLYNLSKIKRKAKNILECNENKLDCFVAILVINLVNKGQ